MGLLDQLFGLSNSARAAYVAPERRAIEQKEYERNEGKRYQESVKGLFDVKPDAREPLYDVQKGDSVQASVLNALTQSPAAKKAIQKPESALDRMRRIGVSLMNSDNLEAQAQGRAMIANYQDTVTGGKQTSNYKDYLSSTNPSERSPERFKEYMANRKMPGGSGGKTGYLTRAEKTQGGLDPDSPFVWKNGAPAPVKTSAYSEANQKASMFAETMQGAEADIEALISSGYDPTTIQQQLGGIPYVGAHLTTGEQQLMNRAQDGWVRAKLRDESGATIPNDEMEKEREIYFPQPGDNKLVIAAKKRARDLSFKGMIGKSGGKFKPYTKAERQAMRDIVSKEIEKAKAKGSKYKESRNVWEDGDGPSPGNFWPPNDPRFTGEE